MTVFGGFDPGTWQAWSLNLLSQVFVKAGIARGFQVTQTSPAAMSIQVNLDPTWLDGVLYLANGAFMRVDAQTTFTISPNTSGSTRTDALIAQVDPTNAGNTSLSVQANWANGFSPTSNTQFVVALISVPNLASSIVNANITMNSSVATITGTSTSGSNTLVASDGVGISLQDNSSVSTMTLVMTGLSTGIGRIFGIRTTDASAIGHTYTFDTNMNITGQNAAMIQLGNPTYGDIKLIAGTGNYTYIMGTNGSGSYTVVKKDGYLYDSSGANYAIIRSAGGGAAGRTIWVGTTDPGSLAQEGDIWVDA